MFPSSSFLSLLCPDGEKCWRGIVCHFSHAPKNSTRSNAFNDPQSYSHNQPNFNTFNSRGLDDSKRPLKRWKGDENFVGDEDSDEDNQHVIVIDEEVQEEDLNPSESTPNGEYPENNDRVLFKLKGRENSNNGSNMNAEEAYDPSKPELNQNYLLSQDTIKSIKMQYETQNPKKPTPPTTQESKKWSFSLNTSSVPSSINNAQNTAAPTIPPKPTPQLFKPPPSKQKDIPIAVSKKYTEHKIDPKDEKLKNGVPVSEYPVIPIEYRSAIPRVNRQALLDKLLIAYLKRYPKDRSLAIKRAVKAEERVQSKSAASKNVYSTFGARKLKAVTQNQEESDDDE
eukprot:TRINITY_DN1147_c0_g1_i1.p1 TRINITY_DN1147_c0_g1~~TRINITY_DN1147_c0_g1_i1.p1  ORF type:complete len:340 (-),score=84.94 TRINITY_DN1147_c0_g1_i1:171-1190(-)